MGKYKIKNLSKKEVAGIESRFKENLLFVKGLLESFPRESRDDDDGDAKDKLNVPVTLPARLCPAMKTGKKPAKTLEELQEKLSSLKGKTSLAYKDKMVKKGLKNRMKKKEKKERFKAKRIERQQSKTMKVENGQAETKQTTKPVYDSEGQMVFSKFDFSELGAKEQKSLVKGMAKDPRGRLKQIRDQKNRLKKLEEQGKTEKVKGIEEKTAWKTVLLKSEGIKIKDDPDLLKTTIKKLKKKKEKSVRRWKANQSRQEKEKKERQEKRQANIEAKSRDKRLSKLKKQAKKGRIIAGF